jgi:molecular chaperone GrpE
VPAGTVVQVIQAGFKIGERMLRPAMVAVSKVGPKAVDPAAAASGNGSQ